MTLKFEVAICSAGTPFAFIASITARCLWEFCAAAAAAVAARDWTPMLIVALSGAILTSPWALVTICGTVGRPGVGSWAVRTPAPRIRAGRISFRQSKRIESPLIGNKRPLNSGGVPPPPLYFDHEVLQV